MLLATASSFLLNLIKITPFAARESVGIDFNSILTTCPLRDVITTDSFEWSSMLEKQYHLFLHQRLQSLRPFHLFFELETVWFLSFTYALLWKDNQTIICFFLCKYIHWGNASDFSIRIPITPWLERPVGWTSSFEDNRFFSMFFVASILFGWLLHEPRSLSSAVRPMAMIPLVRIFANSLSSVFLLFWVLCT